MAAGEIAGDRRRDRRECLRPARTAEVAHHQRDQDHDEPHLECGQDPHGRRRDPQEGDRRGGQERRQRRLVDVAEGGMLAGDDEVHLVAVEAIGTRKHKEPGDHQACDQKHRPGDGDRVKTAVGSAGRAFYCHYTRVYGTRPVDPRERADEESGRGGGENPGQSKGGEVGEEPADIGPGSEAIRRESNRKEREDLGHQEDPPAHPSPAQVDEPPPQAVDERERQSHKRRQPGEEPWPVEDVLHPEEEHAEAPAAGRPFNLLEPGEQQPVERSQGKREQDRPEVIGAPAQAQR